MREGIYIQSAGNGKFTGFVIHYVFAALKVSAFTDCTAPFILEHAAVRGLCDPMVYHMAESGRVDTHSTGLCQCIDETEHLAGNGAWQSHLESVPGEE